MTAVTFPIPEILGMNKMVGALRSDDLCMIEVLLDYNFMILLFYNLTSFKSGHINHVLRVKLNSSIRNLVTHLSHG